MDLSTLNPQQHAAVTTTTPFVRVVAGAGSGKTKVLTYRIVHLIEQFGIAPRAILAITFTNKAAAEMKKRVYKELNIEESEMIIATFHSLCVRILRQDIRVIGYPSDFTILDEDDRERVIKEIMETLKIDREEYTPKQLINFISTNKSAGIDVTEAYSMAKNFQGETLKASAYEAYERYLQRYFYLDFDDLLVKTVHILEHYPAVKTKWSRRFSEILVDEFQDTNDIQYRLIRALYKPDSHIFVVGDPDQTIYTWRGANVDIVLRFHEDFHPCQDIILNQNYRSTKNILTAANTLINYNKFRIKKDLFSDKPDGGNVLYYQAPSQEQEAIWVIDRVREVKNKFRETRYGDFAILFRSNYYTQTIERALINQRIPYRIYGGIRFFERKEVKDAIAYLRMVVRPDDDLAFKRIINTPRRGIGDKGLSNLENTAALNHTNLMTALESSHQTLRCNQVDVVKFIEAINHARNEADMVESNFANILENLLDHVGYVQFMKDNNEEERLESIAELGNFLTQFQARNPDSHLYEAIQEITLYSSQDEIEDGDFISLMTVHTAKGLEFPYVFVIGLSEGVFPNARAVIEDNRGVEEERRLAYVAFTRAMKQLFLSDALGQNFATQSYREASRFIEEVKEHIKPYYVSHKLENIFAKPTLSFPGADESGAKTATTYRNGDLVKHSTFGPGVIIAINQGVASIAFKNPEFGVKQISVSFLGLSKLAS